MRQCGHARAATRRSDEASGFAFQKHLMQVQREVEDAFVALAKGSGRPAVMLLDRGLMDGKAYMEEEQWALGESVKSKGCLAKQCVYTCMGQPADESSGFQFALAGMRFTSENGCGDQPFMPGDNYDLDKFHAYRNQSYKDGGAIAWPEPSTLTPVEPTELELASVFDFASPRAFAAYDVGDVVPIAWRHDGAVSEETVEIYAVPVPDAMPKVGTAPSPRDLQREWRAARRCTSGEEHDGREPWRHTTRSRGRYGCSHRVTQ